MARFWEVVGGTAAGGIVVRSGRELSSPAAQRRLSTGAVVAEVELVGERLRYSLVSGLGPQEGWVSIRLQNKELAIVCEKPASSQRKAAELRDPTYAGELEAREITVGGLKAFVRVRPEGAPKAALAVLLLPGNPVVNSYDCSMPLPLAVDRAFGGAGFPVVRFDWAGVGTNAPGTHPPSQDYEATIPNAYVMYEYAKQLGEGIVVCAWNYSGTMASKLVIDGWPGICAIVSLSFGYKQWEFVKRFVNEGAGEALKQEFEDHSKVTAPALYVFGSKDVHTPAADVERIVKARPDGGEGAEIHVISQEDQKLINTEYFMLKDKEDKAALACVSWLSKLRAKLLETDSPLIGA